MESRVGVVLLVAVGAVVPGAAGADTKAVEAGLTQWIGTAKDGWTPVAFVALRRGMSPAEVGAHFAGAERVIGNTASKVRVSGVPYLQEAQFQFLKTRPDGQNGLGQVILTLERGFFDPRDRYETLVRVLESKFGPMPPGPNALTKGFWRTRTQGESRMAQLIHWGPGQDLQLSFDLPAGAAPPGPVSTASPVASTSVFGSWSCRAVEATQDKVMLEATAANRSACAVGLKDKLRAARCTSGVREVAYRLQNWAVGRWSNGVRLSLTCP